MTSKAKRVLVTGASGFIGGHVCEALARSGVAVRAMVRASSDVRQLDGVDVERCEADLGDPLSLERACAGVDAVVHTAAAVGSFGEWQHFHEVGVLGTERLIYAAERAGVDRFVHISSIATYGLRGGVLTEDSPLEERPQGWNHYVREKVLSEQVLWKAHTAGRIQATAIRPSVVIGARDRNAIPRMADLLRLPVAALPGRADHRFPVVTIDDCVDAILRAVNDERSIGRAYNVSGQRPIRLAEIYGFVARHAKLAPPKLYLPTAMMIPAVGAFEGVWKLLGKSGEPIATRIAIVVSGYDYDVDTTRLQRELGWQARDEYEAAVIAALAEPSAVKPGGARAA